MDEGRASSWGPLVLALVVILAFANTLENDWHFDDHHSILENEAIRSLANVPSFFTDPATFSGRSFGTGMYRPLLLVGYALTHAVGGLSLRLWHVVQVLLHLLCVLAVLRLLRELGASPAAALVAAGLFAVHPIQTQALNYLSSRSEIQGSLFIVLALILAAGSSPGRAGRARRWASVGCTVLALLSKATGVVVPVLVVLQRLWLGPERAGSLRRGVPGALRAALPHAAVVVAYLLLRKLLFGAMLVSVEGGDALTGLRLTGDMSFEGAHHGIHGRSVVTNLLVQASVLWLYLRLLLVPSGLSFCHDVDPSPSLAAWPAVGSVPATVLLVAALVGLRRRAPLVSFAGLFFLVMLVPTSAVPLNLLVNEHRVYLASVGFFLVVAAGVEWLAGRLGRGQRAVLALGGLLVAASVAGTWSRNRLWRSDLSLWGDAVAKAPGSRYPRLMYATSLARAGFEDEALVQYELWHRQFRILDVLTFANAGQVATGRRYLHLARRYLEPVLSVQDPERPRALLAWARLLVLVGRPERALLQMEALEAEYPASPMVAAQRAPILRQVEERRVALERARQALQRAGSDDPDARFGLAAALDAAGRREEAEAAYESALGRWPTAVPALVALADLLGRDGRWAEAGGRAAAALRLAPTNERALELAACSQGAQGGGAEGRETARRLLELTGRVSPEVRWFVGLPPYGEASVDRPEGPRSF